MPATELGGIAIAAALARAGVDRDRIDAVILGQVLQAGCGQLPARQAAVRGGISMSVPSITINKVCLSGLAAVAQADQLIRAGEAEIVVAGGMESMTQAPHLLPGSRSGFTYGDVTLRDHMAYDGLWDAFTDQAMGLLTESCNTGAEQVSRAESDAFAARSHQRAEASAELLAAEITPVEVPQRRGDPLVVSADEGVRSGVTAESLSGLRPAFRSDGIITAASSSPISDGAAALVVASAEVADAAGSAGARPDRCVRPGGRPRLLAPAPAGERHPGSRRSGRASPSSDFDLIEINEAFAAVGLASARALGLSEAEIEERVNVHGGAIALGHPIGASGARLVLHLAYELQRRGSGTAVAALCGGGGQGDALILSA